MTLPAGEDRFTAAEKWLRSVFDAADVDDRVRVRGSGPVAFGTFTFDASSDGSVLIVPRVVLGRDGRGQAWLTKVLARGDDPDIPRLLGGDPSPQTSLGGADAQDHAPFGLRWREGSLDGAPGSRR